MTQPTRTHVKQLRDGHNICLEECETTTWGPISTILVVILGAAAVGSILYAVGLNFVATTNGIHLHESAELQTITNYLTIIAVVSIVSGFAFLTLFCKHVPAVLIVTTNYDFPICGSMPYATSERDSICAAIANTEIAYNHWLDTKEASEKLKAEHKAEVEKIAACCRKRLE